MMLWGSLTRRRSRGPCNTLARQVFGVASDFDVGTVGERDAGGSSSLASLVAEGVMVPFLFIEGRLQMMAFVGGGL
jgi:hypothetical protein